MTATVTGINEGTVAYALILHEPTEFRFVWVGVRECVRSVPFLSETLSTSTEILDERDEEIIKSIRLKVHSKLVCTTYTFRVSFKRYDVL